MYAILSFGSEGKAHSRVKSSGEETLNERGVIKSLMGQDKAPLTF